MLPSAALAVLFALPAPPSKLDPLGDPLPPGAVCRYGTTRFASSGKVTGTAISASGKRYALLFVDAAKEAACRLTVYDAATGRTLGELKSQEPIFTMSFTDDGTLVVSRKGRVDVWAVGNEPVPLPAELLPKLGETVTHPEVKASPDGKVWAVEGEKQTLLIDPATQKVLHTLPTLEEWCETRFSADGRFLIGSNNGHSASVWNVSTGKRLRTYAVPTPALSGISLAPDGSRAYLADSDGVACYPLDGDEPDPTFVRFKPKEGTVLDLRASADGKEVRALTDIGTVFRLDAATGKVLDEWPVPDGTVYDPDHLRKLSADGKTVVGPLLGRVMAWSAEHGPPHRERLLTPHSALAFAKDGKMVRSTDGRTYHTWDAATGKPTAKPTDPHGDHRVNGGFEVGTERAADDMSGVGRVIDTRNGNVLHEFAMPDPGVVTRPAVPLTGDPDRVLIVAKSGSKLHNLKTGKTEREFDLGIDGCSEAGLSADGRTLYSRHEQKLFLYEAATGKSRAYLGRSLGTAPDPDGKHIWSAAPDDKGDLLKIDVSSGKTKARLPAGGYGTATCVAVSADGKRVAAAFDLPGGRHPIVVWEVATKKVLAEFRGHTDFTMAVAFSPDGERVASAGLDCVCYVWDIKQAPAALPDSPAPATLLRFRTPADAVKSLASDDDAEYAATAIAFLVDHPTDALIALEKAFPPAKPVSAADLEKLLLRRNDVDYATRQAADKELERLGPQAEAALRAELDKPRSEEVGAAVERLLEKLEGVKLSGERLAAVRAVEAAERIGTPAARKLIEVWANGGAGATLTAEAKAAARR